MTTILKTILLVVAFSLWAYGANLDFQDAKKVRTSNGEYINIK